MNILLTSNRFIKEYPRSKEIDIIFANIANDKKVLIITNATKDGSNQNAILGIK